MTTNQAPPFTAADVERVRGLAERYRAAPALEAYALAAEVPGLLAALDEARSWVRRLTATERVLTCIYCGEAYPPGSPTHGAEVLTAHAEKCEKHPLRAAIAAKARMEAGAAELRQMLQQIHAISIGDEDAEDEPDDDEVWEAIEQVNVIASRVHGIDAGRGFWTRLETAERERDDARSAVTRQRKDWEAAEARAGAVEGEAKTLRVALEAIVDLAPECDHCSDYDPAPRPKRPITHETTLWGLPVYLCAEHAPDRVASYRKAESKGSGKQPDVVPYVEQNQAIEIARHALAAKQEPPT